jgi:exportin-T
MASQKLALIFLFKFVTTFGTAPSNGAAVPAKTNGTTIPVPGIERFIYNRILLACFTIPSLPDFDPKDAMAVIVCTTLSWILLLLLIFVQVLNEVGNLLQGIVKARGEEAVHHIQNIFLPSQNCPPDTAQTLVVNIRDMDNKAFRKYFSEFIKGTRPAQ